MQFGPLPEKRTVPDFVRTQTQEELALKLLRQRQESEESHRKELRALEKRLDRMAEQLAVITHKKRAEEKDPLVRSLRQLLKREEIELISYVGEPVTEELEEQADIVEWLPAGEDPEDRVVDALEPEVRFQGRVLHRAKLSCRMGAQEPEEDFPEPETVPAEAGEAPETKPAPVEAETPAERAPEEQPSPEEEKAASPEAPPRRPRGVNQPRSRKNIRKSLKKHQKKGKKRP